MAQSQQTTNAKRTKTSIWTWIFLGVIALVIAQYIIITIIIPLMRGSGVGQYTGAKQEAASKAVESVRYLIDNKIRWAYAIHADSVYQTTDEEKAKYCSGDRATITNDINDPHYYTVVVSTKDIGSYNAAKIETLPGCSGSPASW